MVGREGFEPSKAYADRFTVCSLWPLGNLPTQTDGLRSPRVPIAPARLADVAEPIAGCNPRHTSPLAVPLRSGLSWRRDLNPRPADYKSAALPLSYASGLLTGGLALARQRRNRPTSRHASGREPGAASEASNCCWRPRAAADQTRCASSDGQRQRLLSYEGGRSIVNSFFSTGIPLA